LEALVALHPRHPHSVALEQRRIQRHNNNNNNSRSSLRNTAPQILLAICFTRNFPITGNEPLIRFIKESCSTSEP
jgi:hypothetical protein